MCFWVRGIRGIPWFASNDSVLFISNWGRFLRSYWQPVFPHISHRSLSRGLSQFVIANWSVTGCNRNSPGIVTIDLCEVSRRYRLPSRDGTRNLRSVCFTWARATFSVPVDISIPLNYVPHRRDRRKLILGNSIRDPFVPMRIQKLTHLHCVAFSSYSRRNWPFHPSDEYSYFRMLCDP